MSSEQREVADLVARLQAGDAAARDSLFELLYGHLHERARVLLGRAGRDHTLQATALVHEAYVRMVGPGVAVPKGREHFLAVAAQAMRSVLIDHARTKRRKKRPPAERRIALDEAVARYEARSSDILDLDDALKALAEEDAQAAKVVELRFFGGMTVQETSTYLGVPVRTVERDWEFARAWLRGKLQ